VRLAGHHADPATVTQPGGAGASYVVTAARPVYGEEGDYSITVSIKEDGASTIVSNTQTVLEPPITGTATSLATVTEGTATASIEVATFTHAGGVEPANTFSATIDWHDGRGQVPADSITEDANGVYHVTGTRPVYAEEGTYAVTVAISDNDDALVTQEVDSALTIGDAPLSIISLTPPKAFAGISTGIIAVATFTDASGSPSEIEDLQATISWGDGAAEPGSVVPTATPGLYEIQGLHTYAAAASGLTFVVSVSDSDGSGHASQSALINVNSLVVVNTNDDGPGSLRAVIEDASSLPGPEQTIIFALPSGPQTIQLLSPLPASGVPLVMQLDASQDVTVISPAGGGEDSFGAMTKSGAGSLTIEGANNLTGSIETSGGTLAFNFSQPAALAAGVTATANGNGTLELDGSFSALAGGATGTPIFNNSAAVVGVLVKGTNQLVGGIDGSGTLVITAGGQLVANHVVQGALVIGGSPSNGATLTIAASDLDGNPLSESATTTGVVATAIFGAKVTAASGVNVDSPLGASAMLSRPDSWLSPGSSVTTAMAKDLPNAHPTLGIGFAREDRSMAVNSPAAWVSPTSNQEPTPDGSHAAKAVNSLLRPLDPGAIAAALSDGDLEWLSASHGLDSASAILADGNSAPDKPLGGCLEEIGREQVMDHFRHS
jgi:autotransporter-associated beta strand protein